MQRKKVILPAPTAPEPHQRELAVGMQGVWSCALYAAGANVFAPTRPLDPALDPFAAVAGMTGAAMIHDGAPLEGDIDAILLAEVSCSKEGWRCHTRILVPDREPIVLPGRTHRTLSGPLDVMTATLHAIARAIDLYVPREFGWRQLLGVRTVAAGLEALRVEGRQALRHADLEPAPMLH